jgi:hypothetical protein
LGVRLATHVDACICRRDPLSYALSCCTCCEPLVARSFFFAAVTQPRSRLSSSVLTFRTAERGKPYICRSDAVFAGREKESEEALRIADRQSFFFHVRFSTEHVRQKRSSSQTLSFSCVFLAAGGNHGEQRTLICQNTVPATAGSRRDWHKLLGASAASANL